MRKWILKLHMYGGLIACAYLIMLGISSLQFAHHFFPDPKPSSTWERDVVLPLPAESGNLVDDANDVRDALGLFGAVNVPKAPAQRGGGYSFNINRPGKRFAVEVIPPADDAPAGAAAHVKVTETKLPWFIMTALHGLWAVSGSKFMAIWGGYTEFSTIFGVLACVSGIYLFASVKRDRMAALVTTGAALLLSVGLMMYVQLHG